MNDAIFLGSFNPPHLGHLNVIQSVLSSDISSSLKNIHIIPCNQNPNKKNSVPFLYRYYMCKELFEQFSNKVIVNDIEFKHNWKYTYDMLEYISNGNSMSIEDNFLWIITKETFDELIDQKWYKSDDIINKYVNRMIVVCENTNDLITGILAETIVQLMPGFDMHSTDIRNLIKQNRNVELYFNKGVYDIIKENKLYT